MARTLRINGQEHVVDAPDEMPLLWVLRDKLAITGTKFGCGVGICGACMVHVDGVPTLSCQLSVADAEGGQITSIEGIEGKVAEAVQGAWRDLDVVQCGYCQPGLIMTAVGLLSTNQKPTDADIDDAISGNICRCATYVRVKAAIHEAAKRMEA
ncbi:(2Fe-2S)-binding protein [Tabrizicola sp.]|uniref:(2Fe-2S)-binding protein n=1 Tax=Tabrizicola sp. TaxID=2005166 RepID=UPI003F3AC76E